MRIRPLALLLTMALAAMVTLKPAQAATIFINAEGTGDYSTIQAAVNAAATNDVIQLAPGTYTGTGNRRINISRNLTVRGETSWADVIIDCQGSEADPQFAFSMVDETGGILQNLTIRNAWWSNGAVAEAGWGHYIFDSCHFADNHAGGEGGVLFCYDGTEADFRNCVFTGNTAASHGACVTAESNAQVTMDGCSIVRNGSPGGALRATSDATYNLSNCLVAWGFEGPAVSTYYAPDFDISCSLIYGNRGGDWGGGAGSSNINNNLDVDPLLVDPMAPEPNLYLSQYSPCDEGVNPCGRVGAFPRVLIPLATYGVSPDSTGMFINIQEAIDGVPAGHVIALDAATYAGDGNRDLVFNGKNLTLGGRDGEASLPRLYAGGSPTGPFHRHFDFTGTPSSPTLQNLSLREGFMDEPGGSVRLGGGSAPRFDNVTFMDNGTATDGGAVFLDGSGQTEFPEFHAVHFYDNLAEGSGGGMAAVSSTLYMAWFAFEGNQALGDGGGLYAWNCTPHTLDGALYGEFRSNSAANRGGGVFGTQEGDRFLSFNWLFTGNRARQGGGLYCAGEEAEVVSCTFLRNEAGEGAADHAGGAFYADADLVQIRNLTCRENVTYGPGGAGFIRAADVYGSLGTYQANDAGSGGSALHIEVADSSSTVELRHLDILDNICARAPVFDPTGAVYVNGGQQTFKNLNVRGNRGYFLAGVFSDLPVGTAAVDSCHFESNQGGSLLLTDTAGAPITAHVRDCSFIDNITPESGCGGVFGALDSYDSRVDLTDSVFRGNQSWTSGGAFLRNGDSAVTRCVFEGNSAAYLGTGGGGLKVEMSCRIIDCDFIDNTTAGAGGGANLPRLELARNCRFLGNTSGYKGGGLTSKSYDTRIEDCVFWGNTAGSTGAALTGGEGLELSGCTVTNNRVSDPGLYPAQVYQADPDDPMGIGSGVSVENSIISHGQDCAGVRILLPYIYGDAGFTCSTVWHNDLGDGETVPAGMRFEPRFCDWRGGDLTLAADSPCLAENNPCAVQIGALGRGACSYPAPVDENHLPARVELQGNFPNPFNPSTVISFGLPAAQPVSLNVYDVHGSLVRTLVSGSLDAGHHQATWNGRDDRGGSVASGVYFYRLQCAQGVQQGKMVLLK